MKKRKVVIEVLMEAPGGDLVFQPVEFNTSSALKDFAKKAENPVIKHNIEKAAREKRLGL